MKIRVNSKKGLIGVVIIAIILGVMLMFLLINNKISRSDKTLIEFLRQSLFLKEKEFEKQSQIVDKLKKENNDSDIEKIAVLPTLIDDLKPNSIWCPTFQLIWNDLVNEVVKQDVVFNPQEQIAENLNKQEFKEDMISEELYYKTYGLKTLELKEKIEKEIKKKFNEKSSVLDSIDWSDSALHDEENVDSERYIFYAMLKREFNFINKFSNLENGTFANRYENVEYFGINSDTDDKVKDQVNVLYYDFEESFAVEISTKEGDKVIFSRGNDGNNFSEIYKDIENKSGEYRGKRALADKDELKIPNININEKKIYDEIKNKQFLRKDGKVGEIAEAIQTIEFELNSKGGKVKSEAIMDVQFASAAMPDREDTPRYFYFDDEFTIFIKEETKELPYLACRISDISLYQK